MLMPIGRFATASRLSVKSLRNYDASGLLPAVFIDPQSGYRYYRLEQLARADAIRSLRMVDMPLAKIAETLDGDDSELVLTSHLEALERQRDEIDRMAQQLRHRIQLKEYVMSTEVTVKAQSNQLAAAYRTSPTFTEIFKAIPDGMSTVFGYLGASGLQPVGAPFTLYYQAPDGDTVGDIAVCIPVAGPAEASDAVEVIEIPEVATASVVHRGSYDSMGESYATVSTWIHEHGHTILGPAREVYLNSPADVAEADLLTEIHFPIDTDGGE